MRASEAASSGTPVLELDGLAVGFPSGRRLAMAVRGVSFAVRRGETLGIVGESGSGKSVSLLGAFDLLPAAGRVVGGRVLFEGRDLATASPAERRAMLGRDVAFVFQNPAASLDPVMSIGDQLAEAILIHEPSLGRAAARERTIGLLRDVGIDDPDRRLRQYPHEFSGGMCQRALIAMALANGPRLLVADEPTTAIDATVQAQILKLLRDLRARLTGAVVLVSHDLGVVAENTDRLAVMYRGEVVETGPTAAVLAAPRHPYTRGLIACRPSLAGRGRLTPIPGQPPRIDEVIPGCAFQARCPIGRDEAICAREHPPLRSTPVGLAACHFADRATPPITAGDAEDPAPDREPGAPLLLVTGIDVSFARRRGLFGGRGAVKAVDGVDLDLARGEALGIVGESGSGKSTLARVIMRLVDPDRGRVIFDGEDVTALGRPALRRYRDRVQMVFQDPFSSLDPQRSVGDNAAEPLRIRGLDAASRRRRVIERFEEVGLGEEHYDRGVVELSGGQLQRVGIARALVLEPEVLVMDEPVSSLDVSIQAQILNLLRDLKANRHLAYVFISHDMAVVRYLCDRIAVMRAGRVLEVGPTERVFGAPGDDYTKRLIAAIPGGAAIGIST